PGGGALRRRAAGAGTADPAGRGLAGGPPRCARRGRGARGRASVHDPARRAGPRIPHGDQRSARGVAHRCQVPRRVSGPHQAPIVLAPAPPPRALLASTPPPRALLASTPPPRPDWAAPLRSVGCCNMIVVLAGTSGIGKTTIGNVLATRLGWTFEDSDDLHSPAQIATMASGQPLTDADRWPW